MNAEESFKPIFEGFHMSSLNRMQVIGHLGKDPEIRYTQAGKAVANFSVATSIKDASGKETTEWHKVVVWDKQAESCAKYLAKGKMCYVDGRLQTKTWEKDGQKHSGVEIIANTVLFLSSTGNVEQRGPSKNTLPDLTNPDFFPPNQTGDRFPPLDDDIPF